MKKKFNKIELSPTISEIYPVKIRFPDEENVYDFSQEFNDELSRIIAKVFYDRYFKLTKHARGRSFSGIRKFLLYLKENNVTKYLDLDKKCLAGFALWLDQQKFSLSTKYGHYNNIEVLLKDAKKVKNCPLKDLSIPANPFRNPTSERAVPNKLTEDQLKKVLSICYKKIDFYIQEFRTAQEKISELKTFFGLGGNFDRHDKYHVLHYFYKKYGYAPFSRELSHTEIAYISDIGGMNCILNGLTPDAHMLFPFYLVLMFELAANSDALRLINYDCVKEDPLFEDRCFIVWDKPRAALEQKRNVFKSKKYGAYKIIEMIKEITQHTRTFIKEEDKEFLFIVRGEMARKPFLVPHEQSFKWALDFFCKTNDLDFTFNPSDIRPTVLTEMYKARKDVVSVSKIANHKSINTTLLYIVDEEVKKENRKYLSEKQSNILDDILKISSVDNSTEIKRENAEAIGFTCKNPIVDKKVCVNWMAELTNPDLIIPADSQYLSKIIALENAINKAGKIMNQERFELIYKPILNVIEQQVLPHFSKQLIKESSALANKIILPLLEEY